MRLVPTIVCCADLVGALPFNLSTEVDGKMRAHNELQVNARGRAQHHCSTAANTQRAARTMERCAVGDKAHTRARRRTAAEQRVGLTARPSIPAYGDQGPPAAGRPLRLVAFWASERCHSAAGGRAWSRSDCEGGGAPKKCLFAFKTAHFF